LQFQVKIITAKVIRKTLTANLLPVPFTKTSVRKILLQRELGNSIKRQASEAYLASLHVQNAILDSVLDYETVNLYFPNLT